ncbi:MAG: polysaccharide pyruvyl transferase family protein [Cyanothece sp. SIO1E1]|nr:polysaccharide pyruvyl transferase family protein [Cyanothece sp. SIO1E1]
MKVAIWGSYDHGNYGDDVMALQFALALKRRGVNPWVYRLDEHLARKYDLVTTRSVDELFRDADFGIIGGGGILIDKLPPEFEKDFQELHLTTSRYGCPVFPISIGGQGRGAEAPLCRWRTEFFQGNSCQWSTVRLEEDIALLERFDKEAFYYPDVLLSVSDFWQIPPKPESDGKLHVGINLADSFQARLLLSQLKVVAAVRGNITFHFIRTYLPDSPFNWEFLPNTNSPYFENHIYTDPYSTLKFLSSLDLIVSFKLHLGLTALALNVPFYSVGGPGKAHRFLQSVGADFAIWPSHAKALRLGCFLSNPANIRNAKARFDFSKVHALRQESWGHMNRLESLVDSRVQAESNVG